MTRILSFFLILSTLFYCGNLTAQQVAVDNFVKTKGLNSAHIGVNVIDLETGKSVASCNKNKSLAPASVMKVVTTSTALELYGPDYRIPTLLQYSGFIDSSGVLQGDIYIKGGGDPTLGSEYIDRDKNDFFDVCVSAVARAGIKSINGRVIADETCFDFEGISFKWLWEDLGVDYGAGSYGISIYDNIYRLFFKTEEPGSKPQILRTEPNMDDVVFRNYLISEKRDNDSVYLCGIPFTNERWLYGALPANRTEFVTGGSIPDPPYFAAMCLHKALTDAGVSISDVPTTCRILEEQNRETANNRTLLHTYYSPPLSDIIRKTNVPSNNHYADHLLKLSALSKHSQASFKKGTDFALSFWKNKGMNLSGLVLYDGSGLSPSNRLTPQFVTDVLLYMNNKSRYAGDFYASLPIAGKEGTVRNFLKDANIGEVRLKSGSISGVQCYAGYINKGAKRYAFCIMVNDFENSRQALRKAMEKMIIDYAKYL